MMLLMLALLGLVFELCFIVGKRFEEVLPTVTSAAVLLCYILALFKRLLWFEWIVYALLVTGFLYCVILLVQRRSKGVPIEFLKFAITPGVICFIAIAVLFAVAAQPHRVTHTDELYVWSIQPHSIFAHHGLVGPYLNLSPRFMTYTPGISLFQWIGLAINGAWAENVTFLWLWLFYAIMMLPITSHITWKKAYLIPLYVIGFILLPAVFDFEAYKNLRADTALGVCLGYATIQAWRYANAKEFHLFNAVSLALALPLLVLIKQPGIGWALIPIALIVLPNAKTWGVKRTLRTLGAWAIIPVATVLSWIVFCQILGLEGQHMTRLENYTAQAFNGDLPSFQDLLSLGLSLILTITKGSVDFSTGTVMVPQLVWLFVFILFPVILYRVGRLNRDTMRKLVGFLCCGYALYAVVYYFAMLTVFRPEWAVPVQLETVAPIMENILRYGSALWYGLLMLYIDISLASSHFKIENAAKPAKALPVRLLTCALVIICMLNIKWDVIRENLVPNQFTNYELSEKLDELASNSFWTDSIDDPDAIVLLASDSYPYNRGWLQYALAPLKLVMPYDKAFDEDSFRAILRNNRAKYFVSEGTENQLFQTAQAFSEEGYLDAYTVYQVQWNGDNVVLVEQS